MRGLRPARAGRRPRGPLPRRVRDGLALRAAGRGERRIGGDGDAFDHRGGQFRRPRGDGRGLNHRGRRAGAEGSPGHQGEDGVIPRLFGTNGIRGIIGQEMTVDLALGMGKSIGSVFESGPVAVGRDTRTSGPMLRDAAVAGLLATGHDVVDAGVLPTPGLQYFVHTGTFSGGVMITASHNPGEFNGIKVVDAQGMELARPEEEGIGARYFREDFALADWKGVGHVRFDGGAVGRYLEGILSRVDVERIRAARPRVVVDCANAAACGTSPALLSRLGCEVISLNGDPDGTFPGRPPEPVQENLGALMREVRGSKADLGVAHDGDADRAIFVDNRGEFVFGDRSLALVAKDIVSKRGGGVVVTPVSTSRGLEDVVRAAGGTVVYTKVGAPIVARVMLERRAVIGGEGDSGGGVPRD